MSNDGLGARVIDCPKPGWFLVERQYAMDEIRPRFVRDREFVTASIYEEAAPDDSVVLAAEIDGKPTDAHNLWQMKLWPISEAEYEQRRGTHV